MRAFICKTCGNEKSEDCFYKSNRSNCRECLKARAIQYRQDNIENVREYDRNRGQLEHRKLDAKNRSSKYAYLKRGKAWRERNPEKYKAHNIANTAIRDGVLVKPNKCEKCSRDYKIQAHHDDYSKPLDVKWLCTHCHGERHRELNAIKRMAS